MPPYNIILIAVDTLRADHLGCYGYARQTSPHIDRLAEESVVCEQHIATAIPTHPAFATIMTGQYSTTHGIVAHGGRRDIPRTAPWLPETLLRNGYTTCAVDNLSNWRVGFDRGYEFYIDPTRRRKLSINADNRELNRRVIPWMQTHSDETFFLFIHYWDPHTPYLPPRAYRKLFYKGDPSDPANRSLDGMERHPLGKTWRETWLNQLGDNVTDAEYIVSLYDGEIRFCDEGIGHLLQAVREAGLWDNTIIMLIGDHGELMYRHGIFFDHHGLYDGNLHVPCIIRHPELAPHRVRELTGHVDIAPTLLDFAGVAPPDEMEGQALMPWLGGRAGSPLRDFITSQECTWQMKWCLRNQRHKFILAREEDFYCTPPRELYDLEQDPQELVNLADEQPQVAQTLEAQLESWIQDKMRQNGLEQDPLIAHGITLGQRWKETREG